MHWITLFNARYTPQIMSILARTTLLLTISNMFMLMAWYLHLKMLSHRPWYVASLISWGIAFLNKRYIFQRTVWVTLHSL